MSANYRQHTINQYNNQKLLFLSFLTQRLSLFYIDFQDPIPLIFSDKKYPAEGNHKP